MNGKHMLKRFGALFLCLVLFVSLLPAGGSADSFPFKAPKLVSLEKQGDALVLTWEKVAGAPSYGVWRKTDGGGWQSIAQKVAGPTYKDTDITGGKTYTYTVRCLNADGSRGSWFDEAGLSKYYEWPCATPTLISGLATGNSFIVKWNAVSGAASYALWRKDNGSGWQHVKSGVKETSFTDYNVQSGHTYTYTVRAQNGSGKIVSWFDTTGVTGTVTNSSWAYATPVLKSATYVDGGVQITWDAVKNAPLYGVWRKTNGGAWQRIATTTATSYKDTTTHSGNSYLYTVRIQDKDGKMLSWFDPAGIAPASSSFATPKLQSVTNTANGVQFVWDPVAGVRQYVVFRRDGSGGWHAIKSGVKTNSYLDTDVRSGVDYTYTVRCLNDAGQWASWFESPGLSIRYFPCATPDFTLTSTKEGMKISWPAISGVNSYRIYRMNNGNWVWIGSTSSTTFTDKQVVSGTSYTYAVRCQTADTKTVLSWFNVKSETYYGDINIVTKLSYGENTDGYTDDQFLRGRSVVVEWRDVQGAEAYRIFRKANGGTQWKALTGPTCPYPDVTKSKPRLFIDTQVVSGTTYTYTVRAIDGDGKFVGEVDTVGKSILYYDAPDILETTADVDGITVTWHPVAGIRMYQVYRKITTGGGWDLIGSTPDLFFTDKNVVPQKEYQYTVRCVGADGVTLVSGFDRVAEAGRTTAKWLNTPVLVSATLKENTVTLVWMGVDLANRYEVLRRLNDESWQHIAYVDSTSNGEISYEDVFSSMVSGATYSYTVCCVSGTKQISSYNKDGLQVRFYEVPRITKLENKANGVYLEWNATDFSNSYTIYRKTGDNNWERVGNSTVSNFTDTTAVNSLTYVYAVSSTDEGSSLSSDFFKDNRVSDSITYFKIPELVSIAIEGNGLRIKWAAVDGITDYRVYRKAPGESTTYFDVSGSNEYYDTSVNSGTTYTYSVRCKSGSGIVSEYDSNLLQQLYLSTPVLGTTFATSNAVKVSWNAVVGADSYQIYRKDKDGNTGWDWVGSVAANVVDYTDTNEVRAGQEYVYTVRAKKGDVVSDFDATGLTVLTPVS